MRYGLVGLVRFHIGGGYIKVGIGIAGIDFEGALPVNDRVCQVALVTEAKIMNSRIVFIMWSSRFTR